MPKVKILEVYCTYTYNGYEYDYERVYNKGEKTDWEEVTDEEFKLLRRWVKDNWGNDPGYILITESSVKVKKIVADYLQKAKEEEEKKSLAEKKRIAREEKRKLTIQLKKEEREKKLLQKLKGKYEG